MSAVENRISRVPIRRHSSSVATGVCQHINGSKVPYIDVATGGHIYRSTVRQHKLKHTHICALVRVLRSTYHILSSVDSDRTQIDFLILIRFDRKSYVIAA